MYPMSACRPLTMALAGCPGDTRPRRWMWTAGWWWWSIAGGSAAGELVDLQTDRPRRAGRCAGVLAGGGGRLVLSLGNGDGWMGRARRGSAPFPGDSTSRGVGPSKGPIIRPRIHGPGPSSSRGRSPIAGSIPEIAAASGFRRSDGWNKRWTAARAQDCRGRGRIRR